MFLIILLGLIAKLALVCDGCDVGTQDVRNFDFYRIADSEPGYVLLHSFSTFDNNLDCVVVKYAPPQGNKSLSTIEAFDESAQKYITLYGYATNWNSNGYYEVYHSVSLLNGSYYMIAIDYDRFAISKICPFETNTTEVYVTYRSKQPDAPTQEEVLQELQKNNIDISQLVKRKAVHCQ